MTFDYYVVFGQLFEDSAVCLSLVWAWQRKYGNLDHLRLLPSLLISLFLICDYYKI